MIRSRLLSAYSLSLSFDPPKRTVGVCIVWSFIRSIVVYIDLFVCDTEDLSLQYPLIANSTISISTVGYLSRQLRNRLVRSVESRKYQKIETVHVSNVP